MMIFKNLVMKKTKFLLILKRHLKKLENRWLTTKRDLDKQRMMMIIWILKLITLRGSLIGLMHILKTTMMKRMMTKIFSLLSFKMNLKMPSKRKKIQKEQMKKLKMISKSQLLKMPRRPKPKKIWKTRFENFKMKVSQSQATFKINLMHSQTKKKSFSI